MSRGRVIQGTFLAAIFLAVLFIGAKSAKADTEVGGFLSVSETWTVANSPYIIDPVDYLPLGGNFPGKTGLGLKSGAILTIEPGVVVKLKPGASLSSVFGTIIANGTPSQRIIFTSNQISPAPGDWGAVELYNHTDQISFADASYGDSCFSLVKDENGAVKLTDSTAKNCNIGIQLAGNSNIDVERNLLQDNGYGIFGSFPNGVISYNQLKNGQRGLYLLGGPVQLTVEHNEITGFTLGLFIQFPTLGIHVNQNNIYGNTQWGALIGFPESLLDATNNWWGDPSGPNNSNTNRAGLGNSVSDGITFEPWLGQKANTNPPSTGKTPVIIIPGIMGTELYDQGNFLWPNLGLIIDRLHDQFLLDHLSLDADGHSISTSVEVGGIVKKVLNVDTFDSLINSLIAQGYDNSDLFYFSYDWRLNLDDNISLLNDYVSVIKQETNSNKVDIIAHSMGGLLTKDYINKFSSDSVDKLIFVGTPNLGAPKAAKTLLYGDLDIPFNLLNKDTVKIWSLNMPSTYELLPIQTYFNNFQGYFLIPGVSLDPLPYNSTQLFLTNHNLNSGLLNNAKIFQAKDLENTNFGSTNVYNIAGCGLDTQAAYMFKNSSSPISGIGYTSGDGTVPLVSADYINIPGNNKFYVKKVKHSNLPSNQVVRSLISEILQNQSIVLNNNLSHSQNFCSFKGKKLAWHSPVDVDIYDNSGNHSGPISNGALENNIPGADYEIIDGEKFIFLPTDEGQTYQVVAKGQTTGSFDLMISDNDNGTDTQTSVYNDVSITSQSIVNFDLSDTSIDNTIKFDQDSSGQFVDLFANSLLNGSQQADLVPPVTSYSLNGTIGTNSWYRSNVILALTPRDDNSGILVTKYSLDNGTTFHSYLQPLNISIEGTNNIQFYSVDKAGNDETIQKLVVKIDKTAPEFSIKFDPAKLDLVFMSPDGTVVDNDDIITATDQAGNQTVIALQDKQRKKNMKSLVKGLSYNGQALDISKTVLRYNWTLDKKTGALSGHEQHVRSKKDFNIDAVFANNLTSVTGKDQTGKINQTKPGLYVLEVTTNLGDFSWR